MKKLFKIFTLILAVILCIGAQACNVTNGGGKDPSNQQNNGFTPDDKVEVDASIVTTDPSLYQEYQEQSLPVVLNRVKAGVVAINVTSTNVTTFGSGIVIANSSDGQYTFIATSHSLVSTATAVSVVDYITKTEYSASPVGTDPITDICVLRIAGNLPSSILYAQTSNILAGESVFALGNVMGSQSIIASSGMISATNYQVSAGEGRYNSYFLTNADYAPGSLGGGVFTQTGGFLVGMFCTGSVTSLPAYIIPADVLAKVCQEIMENGYVLGRYKLGVTVADNKSGWGITESVSVTKLASDGCLYANGTGLSEGDIIHSFVYDKTNYPVTKAEEFYNYLYSLNFAIGDQIIFNVERNGTKTQVVVVIKQYDYFETL